MSPEQLVESGRVQIFSRKPANSRTPLDGTNLKTKYIIENLLLLLLVL